MKRALAGLLTLLSIAFSIHAKELEHRVTLDPALGHLVQVESRFPARTGEPLTVMMAVWTPGSYLIREFARHLEGVEAFDGSGRPLAIDKISKNRWQVAAAGDEVRLHYRVYARELTVRTSFFDDEFALLNPTTLFMVPLGGLDLSHAIRLELPPDWHAFSALEHRDGTFHADDFDQLADSPIVAGHAQVARFEVRGIGHHLVHLGDTRFWDVDRSAADVATLVSRHLLFWGDFPYREPYFFFNLITDAGGGLEHQRSTVMMAKRRATQRREDYVDWLSLVSHEFFHVWNIKDLRPSALSEYDYENENYTRSLWFGEGLTSYYGPLLLVRAGLISPQEYFKVLAARIRELETRPGRRLRSLEAASFDAWIKHYRPDENSVNSTVSYYNKGAVAGFLLDAEIRRRSEGRHSLDDLMRLIRSRHAGNGGFDADDVRTSAAELIGESMDDWFEAVIGGVEPLDYTPALHYFGIELVRRPQPEQASVFADPPRSSLWIGTEVQDGRLVVTEVNRDGPGLAAGLQAEDEILAIDGVRVLPDVWKDLFAQLRVGQEVEVLVSRRGRIKHLSATLAEEVAETWELRDTVGAGSAVHRQRLADWLGAGWYPPLSPD